MTLIDANPRIGSALALSSRNRNANERLRKCVVVLCVNVQQNNREDERYSEQQNCDDD